MFFVFFFAPCSTILFTHFASCRPISTLASLFFSCSLPLPEMCQNSLGFLPCLPGGGISLETLYIPGDWRAAGAAKARLFCSVFSPLLFSVVDQQPCSLGWGWGRIVAVDIPPTLKLKFFCLTQSFTVNRLVLNDSVEFLTKARKVCSPWLDLWMWERPDTCVGGCWGPCSWRAPTSWSNKRDEETVLWHREDPVKITHWGQCLRTHISLLFFFSTLFPTSPIQAFPELYVPAATWRPLFQTQNSGLDEWEYIIDIWKHEALS